MALEALHKGLGFARRPVTSRAGLEDFDLRAAIEAVRGMAVEIRSVFQRSAAAAERLIRPGGSGGGNAKASFDLA